ncbi:MAG TPA: hypothetical protein VGB21_00330, partial [Candidatus Methylomirabilis sp.]
MITDQTAGLVERQMGESAGRLGEIVNAFDKAQRLAQYNEGVVKLTQGLVELKDKYEHDTDYYTVGDRAKKDLEDLKQGIITATPNPQVAAILGQEFDQKSTFAFSDIRGVANKGIISDVKAKSFAALEARGKAYLAADNEIEREHERNRIEETIQAMVTGDILSPVEGEAVRQKTFAGLERAQVFADMDKVGPDVVLKLLKQGEYDLDPETKFELEREVAGEAERRRKKAKGDYEITVQAVEADVVNKILSPGGPRITLEELAEKHGNGLSTDSYQKWEKVLKDRLGKTAAADEVEFALGEAYKAVDRLYTTE